MTISEAVRLVLMASALGVGSAETSPTFVLDMGQPIRIVDLATRMIRLAGFEPGLDIDIVFSGLRPGRTSERRFSNRPASICGKLRSRASGRAIRGRPILRVLASDLAESEERPSRLTTTSAVLAVARPAGARTTRPRGLAASGSRSVVRRISAGSRSGARCFRVRARRS